MGERAKEWDATSAGVAGSLGRPLRPAPVGQTKDVHIAVRDESDVAVARQHVRELGRKAGLGETALNELTTAVSEIVRNVVTHAHSGEMFLDTLEESGKRAVVVTVCDAGPGISEPAQAMADGYSTTKTLGLGLSSARRLVNDFQLVSAVGKGTTVVLKKWTN